MSAETLARLFGGFLAAVHVGLGAWALVGFAELFLPAVPWTRLSNPLFSPPMLFLQWLLIAAAATLFVVGYLARWRHTPEAMALVYAAMAGVCAYQTFFILTHESRFRAMAIEYVEYAVILLFLFHSATMQARFGR
jgi:hypothetical protein